MASTTYLYRVTEIFSSIQGEGLFSGTPMDFVRLAGCNVGVVSHSGGITCHSMDGTAFVCDTKFGFNYGISAEDILRRFRLCHPICITGGEPFLQDLYYLAVAAIQSNLRLHVETNGTLPFRAPIGIPNPKSEWIDLLQQMHVVCSPKIGYNSLNSPYVDEWKFMVGVYHPVEYWYDAISYFLDREDLDDPAVLIQPINYLTTVNSEDLELALKLVNSTKNWRLSIQLHKVLGLR